MTEPAAPALRIRDVTVSFGGVHAVSNFSLDVPAGSVTSVIGPNGSGKTTLLNAISGFVPSGAGSISLGSIELTNRPAWKRPQLGIGRTFQNGQLFGNLTALENVVIGSHIRQKTNPASAIVRWRWSSGNDRRARAEALESLSQLGIQDYADSPARSLPLGGQKLLAIARALASRPKVLLLDEPAAGLVSEGIDELSGFLRGLVRDGGLTIILVEHHMRLVMGASDLIAVMREGAVLTTGDPATIRNHPEVISVYLGTAASGAAVDG